MRNDPLRKAEEPRLVHQQLPARTQPTLELLVDTELLDRLAEQVSGALKHDSEADFERALDKIERLPKTVNLYEVVDPLGCYNSAKKTITIDPDKIARSAAAMKADGQNISKSNLEHLVEIHEGKHALHHLAQDSSNNNRIWDEFSHTPSYLLETLAQLFTYHEAENNIALETTFLELEKRQTIEYRLWRLFKYVPEESFYWRIRDEPHRIDRILEKMGFNLPRKAISGWDLRRIAKEIENDREGNIHGNALPDVVGENYPYPSTCYPGKQGNECFETAFFFSLTARRYVNPDKGHMSFRQMLGCLVRHMSGDCGRITKSICMFTDNWDPDAYDELKPFIDEIKRTVNVSACLIIGKNYSWFGV